MAKRLTFLIIALVCALIGCLILNVSMRQGPGIGGDATIYITSARNLLAGNGLGLLDPAGHFRLIPYFPPFYPLVLAFCGWLGLDIPACAAALNLLLFGGLIFLASFQTSRLSGNAIPGAGIGLLLAGSPALVPAYSWAMSEPLSILTGFAGLMLLADYLKAKRRSALIGSAVLCGLSVLTRYGSAAFLVTGALLLLFFQLPPEVLKTAKERLLFRLRATFCFSLIGILPIAAWLAYDWAKTRTIASRSAAQGSLAELWLAFLSSIQKVFGLWFFPDSWLNSGKIPSVGLSLLFWLILLFCLLCFLVTARKTGRQTENAACASHNMLMILSAFVLIYVLVIAAVALKTYPPITINTRMLLPAFIGFFWMICLIFGQWLHTSRPWLRIALSLLLLGFCAFSGLRGVRIARQNAIDGLGYNAVSWKNSDLIGWVRENIPADQTIVTNEETALLFLLDRASWPIHEVYVTKPDEVFYAYESGPVSETDAGRQAFQRGEALLVVFDSFEDQMGDIYGSDTQQRIEALFENLEVVYDGDDGTVYRNDRNKMKGSEAL